MPVCELVKIKEMFSPCPIRYIELLLCRKAANAFAVSVFSIQEESEYKEEGQEPNMFSTSCKSIFYNDERNHRNTKKNSLLSENLRINE